MWHSFILTTSAYKSFCDKVNNGVYLGHDPTSFTIDSEEGIKAYEKGLLDYKNLFNQDPPKNI